jgi:hypothetical protein
MDAQTVRLETAVVDRILEQTGGAAPITFGGLPGTAQAPDHIRLYQDRELNCFVEVPSAAVLESRQSPNSGPAIVQCRPDTRIRVGVVTTMNAEVVLAPTQPQIPAEMIPLEGQTTIPKLPAPKPPKTCHMSVRWIPHPILVMGPEGPIQTVIPIPVFVLDCY